jgi:hypothetical protein
MRRRIHACHMRRRIHAQGLIHECKLLPNSKRDLKRPSIRAN